MIFPDAPFDFLQKKLDRNVETMRSYMDGSMKEWERVRLGTFVFQTDLRPAKPTPEAKKRFFKFFAACQ